MNNYLKLAQPKKPIKLPSNSPVSDPDVDLPLDDDIEDMPYDNDDILFDDDLDNYSGRSTPYISLLYKS